MTADLRVRSARRIEIVPAAAVNAAHQVKLSRRDIKNLQITHLSARKLAIKVRRSRHEAQHEPTASLTRIIAVRTVYQIDVVNREHTWLEFYIAGVSVRPVRIQ